MKVLWLLLNTDEEGKMNSRGEELHQTREELWFSEQKRARLGSIFMAFCELSTTISQVKFYYHGYHIPTE